MINPDSESYKVARATYLKVGRLVAESLARMAPLILEGLQISDSFASTDGWKRLENQIDEAVGRDDLERVKVLCAQYEDRANTYVEAFEAKFKEKAETVTV